MKKKKIQRRPGNLLKQCVVLILILNISIRLVYPAEAYSLAYIQTSIDVDTWEIIAVAIRESVGVSSRSPEVKRVDQEVLDNFASNSGDWSGSLALLDSDLTSIVETRDKELNTSITDTVAGVLQNWGGFEEENRVLSFPTKQDNRNDSTATDYNNALNVIDDILYDLNEAFNTYCTIEGISKTPDASAYLSNLKTFLGSLSPSGDTVTYPSSDTTIDGVTYKETTYTWQTTKGTANDEYGSETVNWFMLIYEGFNNYSIEGDNAVTQETVYSSTPNTFTKTIVGFFSSLLDGLRGILGLWSMDELLFSEGLRERSYVGGIFPNSWEPTIWALFFVMEVFAALVLVYAIINNVVKKAMSTTNSITRVHFMTQLENLIICAVALSLLPFLLRVVISLSSSFTQMIKDIIPVDASTNEPKSIAKLVSKFSASSGSIGGIVAQFLYFGIVVYFNFFYALRGLAVALLIIIAPVMVAMIGVSDARKQMTITWAKELLAQICIQPIQAFIVTVILILPTSSHGFDNIIALYALIPFTSMLRGLFFGSSGSMVDQIAQKAKSTATGVMAGTAFGAASAAGGVAAGAISNAGRESKSGEKNNTDGAAPDLGVGNLGGANNGGTAGEETGSTGDTGNETATATTAAESFQNAAAADNKQSGSGSTLAKVGSAVKTGAKAAGTIALGAVGGGLAASGIPGAAMLGRSMVNYGSTTMRSNYRHQENQPNTAQTQAATTDSTQTSTQTSAQTSAQTSSGSVNLNKNPNTTTADPLVMPEGTRRANQVNKDGKDVQVQDYKPDDQQKMGIQNLEDTGRSLEFTASGNSEQAQELGAYADYLQGLSTDERSAEIAKRGISATRTGDGVSVSVDKRAWSAAHSGAQLSTYENKRTGETVMRMQNPTGQNTPSLTGGVKPAEPVDTSKIPSVTRATVTQTRTGKAVTPDTDIQKQCLDSGMSPKTAAKAASRVAMQREYQNQGMSSTEAAQAAKQDMSGAQSADVVSIPKAELSQDQNRMMNAAQESGTVRDAGDSYNTVVPVGSKAPTFEAKAQGTSGGETSFRNAVRSPDVTTSENVIQTSPNQSASSPANVDFGRSVQTPAPSPAPDPVPSQESTPEPSSTQAPASMSAPAHSSTQASAPAPAPASTTASSAPAPVPTLEPTSESEPIPSSTPTPAPASHVEPQQAPQPQPQSQPRVQTQSQSQSQPQPQSQPRSQSQPQPQPAQTPPPQPAPRSQPVPQQQPQQTRQQPQQTQQTNFGSGGRSAGSFNNGGRPSNNHRSGGSRPSGGSTSGTFGFGESRRSGTSGSSGSSTRSGSKTGHGSSSDIDPNYRPRIEDEIDIPSMDDLW